MPLAKIRIVQTIAAIAEQATGPAYTVVRLTDALRKQNAQVALATLAAGAELKTQPDVHVFPTSLGPSKLGCSSAMHHWLRQRATQRQVDLIHNHGLWMMPNLYPGWVASRYKLKFVVSPRGMLSEWALSHGSPFKKVIWWLWQKSALKKADCFHATSDIEYKEIRAAGFRQPVAIIPNGIDLPLEAALPKQTPHPQSPRKLLFLGRIHPKKGIDMLLQAWAIIQAEFPQWHLQIVGPDNNGHLGEMQGLARTLQLERVEFIDTVYEADKWAMYGQADLFVLPTYSENFGMTVAEALVCGIPAIVTHGAPWSALDEKKAGWWIEIGVEPLVACLRKALGLPGHDLAAMGQQGKDWISKDFTWDGVGEMMWRTYQWLMYGGKKPEWVSID